MQFKKRFKRVPIIMQTCAQDCGPACLTMILAYHGRRLPLDTVRQYVDSSRDGTSANSLLKAAKDYGMEGSGFLVEPSNGLKTLELPVIVHFKTNHYVVLEKIQNRHAMFVDPREGRQRVKQDEFFQLLSGIVLSFKPNADFCPSVAKTPFVWHRYFTAMICNKSMLGGILSLSAIGQLTIFFVPVITAFLVDHVIPEKSYTWLSILGVLLVSSIGAGVLSDFWRQWLLASLHARLDQNMVSHFFKHLLALPFSFFQARSIGDLLMRLGSHTMIRDLLSVSVVSTLLDTCLAMGYLVLAFVRFPSLAILIVALVLLQMGLAAISSSRLRILSQIETNAQVECQGCAMEAIRGIATIKATAAESAFLSTWLKLFNKQIKSVLRRHRITAAWDTVFGLLRQSGPVLVLWVGTTFVLDGRLSLGSMVGFNVLAAAFFSPWNAIVDTFQQLQIAGTQLYRINDVLDSPVEAAKNTAVEKTHLKGELSLYGVSLRYNTNEPFALQDINLEIKPGQIVALVGPSGSGKSTLAKIVATLYQPLLGSVFFDGKKVDELGLETIRKCLGVVLQDDFLFQGTIHKNIAFHNENITLQEVQQAAKLAAIDDEINHFPLGYDTWLNEMGSNLSGGQRQRLCLARALVSHPPILILDEAMSELDSLTEKNIFDNLTSLGVTCIIVAHRLSSIRKADLIIAINKGRIVERGSHSELIEKGGLYKRMVEAQSGPL